MEYAIETLNIEKYRLIQHLRKMESVLIEEYSVRILEDIVETESKIKNINEAIYNLQSKEEYEKEKNSIRRT